MRPFILFVFWSFILSIIIKALSVSTLEYPRKVNLRYDVVGLIESIAWATWAAIVLWII